MTTRKSTRLQNLPIHERSEQPVIANAARKKSKPNPPSAPKTHAAAKGKGKVTNSTASKRRQAQIQAPSGSVKDELYSLPPEILKLTLDNITDHSTISSLGRTCRNFYTIMMPRLYKTVSVSAAYHAHIPKLIRTLEPHLSIAQKKQLKKEGKYKGQVERYPSGLNEMTKPICATYVSQMIVGHVDPGRKHKYIVDRYVEEAFKNMDNLQIVETQVYTKSIGKSIASLKNLKALRLFASHIKSEDIHVLDKVNDLKHLYIQDNGSSKINDTTKCMLQNSTSTLQSLVLETGSFSTTVFSWPANATFLSGNPVFTALESLSFSGMTINADVIKSFSLIDFMRLRELILTRSLDDECLLFPYLTSLATAAQKSGVGISLRHLNVHLGDSYHWHATPAKDQAAFDAKCQFVSSFNTLTTLELPDYTYKKDVAVNPGLRNAMLQAILKHKNLKVLRIKYGGISSGSQIPYLSAANVRAICEGLPKLEEFEFAPDEGQMAGIGNALAKGNNLKTIKCYPYPTWSMYPPPERPGFEVLSGIVKGFLARDDEGARDVGDAADKPFIWEDHCKLRIIEIGSQPYGLASAFGKLERKAPPAEKMTLEEGDEGRVVWFRVLRWSWNGSPGFDLEHPWVSKVGKLLG